MAPRNSVDDDCSLGSSQVNVSWSSHTMDWILGPELLIIDWLLLLCQAWTHGTGTQIRALSHLQIVQSPPSSTAPYRSERCRHTLLTPLLAGEQLPTGSGPPPTPTGDELQVRRPRAQLRPEGPSFRQGEDTVDPTHSKSVEALIDLFS